MGKRDIQIDYDAIDDILRALKKYSDGLEKMRNAVEKVNETINASNDAESIKKLEKRYRKTKKRLDDSYEEVNALYMLLKNYKNDMTAIIKPKKGMTRVGRNDIYWNLKAIKAAIHEIQNVKSDVPLNYEDGTGCTDEEKQRMEENYQKLENQVWNSILSDLNKALDESEDKLEKYYKEKVVEYENMDDHYQWEAEKLRMKYASTWEHMKQAGISYAEEKTQITKGALRAVMDIAEGVASIKQVMYYVNGTEIAAVVKHLSPNPPEWTEKMLRESKEYFGEFAEILAQPMDVVKAMAQNTSDTYEIEGASYMGAYVVADVMIGKATASTISKAAGKGVSAVDDIAGIANKADDVADVAKTAGKVDDVVDAAKTAEKTGDVAEMAGKGESSTVERLTSESVKNAIEKNGLTVDEFSKLLDPNKTLSLEEMQTVEKIRNDIGLPSVGTVMNKTIPQSDIYKYLYDKKYNGVRGFVSVDEHSALLKTLKEIYEGNRLDYNNTAFKTSIGVDGVSQLVGNPDTVYGKITYILNDADSVKLPTDIPTEVNAPYTGRGFTGSKKIVLPELVQNQRGFIDGDILSIYDSITGELTQVFVYDSDLGWIMK